MIGAFDWTAARRERLDRLAAEPLDLLIVGGGIVGAAVARDAALRGLSTGLVEQADFASGTSGRSSRLLHGGLRYLAQGRVGLVHQASREKRILHRIAPHLAAPLPFLFPAWRGEGWPLWQLRVGVGLYDLLCAGRNLGPSAYLGAADALRRQPLLAPSGLQGAMLYFDGLTSDHRLVLDTLSAAAEAGATALNHCRFQAAAREGGMWSCRVEALLEGKEAILRSRCLVNASGPWADRLPGSRVRLRLTKGIHVVVDRRRLPAGEAVVLAAGGRILFAIPWGERVILGTTDTDYGGPIDEPPVEPADVAEVLAVVNRAFPGAGIGEGDVLAAWAGLRPLLASRRQGGASDISRGHRILAAGPDRWDVAGGKLTTCRLMAEYAVNRVVRRLGRRAAPCRTAVEPLLRDGAARPFTGIVPPAVSRDAVDWYCRKEQAIHLDDVLRRRAGWGLYLPAGERRVEEVARWMGEVLGWDDAARAREIAALPR